MSAPGGCGVLIAAHGERGGAGDNANLERLAAAVSRRLAAEVRVGLIKGTPGIAEAARAFTAPQIILYPLFFSDGYFVSVRLPQLLSEAGPPDGLHTVRILPPLGLDPGLSSLVAAKAAGAARDNGYADRGSTVVLLAHGSTTDPASRRATEHLAGQLRARAQFAAISAAFLEESPMFEDVITSTIGPTVVVGLFAGEGLHGAEDVPRLIAATGRSDVCLAGNAGTWPEIEGLVAAAISR